MSADIVAAWAAIQARAQAQISLQQRWPDEDALLPDEPEDFVYFELLTERGAFIEIGGGRGNNRFQNDADLVAYVFVPRGKGLAYALSLAEPVAAAFRSFKDASIACNGATVHPVGQGEALVPPGLASIAGNYACAMVSVPLSFVQTA